MGKTRELPLLKDQALAFSYSDGILVSNAQVRPCRPSAYFHRIGLAHRARYPGAREPGQHDKEHKSCS